MAYNTFSPIVTNGLVFYLDAANNKSYPGSGTSWNDMGSTGAVGTLINGTTYTLANGGSIVFDGVDDGVDFSATDLSSTGDITIDTFLKINGTQVAYADILDYNHAYSTPSVGGFVVQQNYNSSSDSFYFAWWNGFGYDFCYFQAPINNTYFHLVITKIGVNVIVYINGVSSATGSGSSYLGAVGLTMTVGNLVSGGRPLKGTIGYLRIYDKGLTTSEVLQNYNALKNRFI
jgi:hypothetical protein